MLSGLGAGVGTGAGRVPPRRVLVVLDPKGIGDAAEALGVFELIHRHWPQTEVAAAVARGTQAVLLERSGDVSRVVLLPGGIRDVDVTRRRLPRDVALLRGVDDVLVLARREGVAWPFALAARLAGARLHHRHGYRYRIRRKSPFADFPAHVFFQLVTSELLLQQPLAELARPHLEPAADDRRYAEELFARHGLDGSPVVLLNTRGPQYGVGMGRWGIERYLAAAQVLLDHGIRVVVNGGSVHQMEEFRAAEHLADPRVVLLERPTVGQLAAVLERCTVVVGEPAGPMCVAMAVGTPTVSIQGPGERDYPGHNRSGPLWWPEDPRHVSVSRVAWCQHTTRGACLCSRDTKSRTKQRLEPLHLWKPYKRLLTRLGVFDRLHPSRWTHRTFTCLEHLTPDEVARAVLAHVGTVSAVPAAPVVPVAPVAQERVR